MLSFPGGESRPGCRRTTLFAPSPGAHSKQDTMSIQAFYFFWQLGQRSLWHHILCILVRIPTRSISKLLEISRTDDRLRNEHSVEWVRSDG